MLLRMELETRQLRMIRAIGDAGSLTKAAASLGLTQPALTYQLQRVEQMLGGSLFFRDKKGARPTALGQLVIDHTRVLLPSLDKLIEEAQLRTADRDEAPRVIRFAGHPTPLAGPVIQRLRELATNAEITMRQQRGGHDAMDLLASGGLELATLLEHPNLPLPRPPDVIVRDVVTEPVFVAMASTNPLSDQDEVCLGDLAGQSWILPADLEIGCGEYLRGLCEQAGFTPHVAYRLSGYNARDVLERGLGMMPVQATTIPAKGISVLPIKDTKTELRHMLAMHSESPVARYCEQLAAAAAAGYWDQARRSQVYVNWLGNALSK